MNDELRAYLRIAAPNMPPEVAWPVMETCKKIERMEDLPEETRRTISHYLPAELKIRKTHPLMAFAQGVLKRAAEAWDESKHPRGKTTEGSNAGSFAPTAGAEGGGGSRGEPATGPGTLADLRKIPSMGDRRDAFMAMTQEHRDALANPRETVPARVDELLGPDHPFTDLKSYLDNYNHILPPDNRAMIEGMMTSLKGDAQAAGMDEQTATQMQHALTRLVVAQDYEAAGRTLGDHGAFHINGDAQMAKDILSVLPTNVNTPEARLRLAIAAAVHDVGYLTPTSREFLDMGHARWGSQYFDEHLRPQLDAVMGKDFGADISRLITDHANTNVDWQASPEVSALSTADNFALFHREKMPPMLRHVPGNIDALVRLGTGELKLEDAKAVMRANVTNAEHLTPELKSAYHRAIEEVSGALPKYTLGMVGTAYKGVKWNGEAEALEVKLERHKANEGLARVVDFGQQQFHKVSKDYGTSADDLLNKGMATFYDPKTHAPKIIMILKVKKEDLWGILKGSFFG